MLTGILCGLAAGALWGVVFVFPRLVPGFSEADVTVGRFLAYGAIAGLSTAVRLRRSPLPTLSQAAAAGGMSVLGFTGYYLVLVYAIRDAGVAVPSLIIGTIPLWMMLLGKPGHLRWQALLPGLILTAAGLALMTRASYGLENAGDASYWRGIALAVVSMLAWTIFGLANASWLRRHPDVDATDWANWLGIATGLGALLLALAIGSPPRELFERPQFATFAALCVLSGFGSSWLATILWNIASRRLSASLCGQLIVSETLFALLYSFLLEGRWPTAAQATAAVLFTLGILASIRAHR
ncbi:MAG TPA: DMT family transporter [Burkholderiales bacterium]|nr:DMT family transporter [Burkholderiales bacterium]